jgi:hypothetical protein
MSFENVLPKLSSEGALAMQSFNWDKNEWTKLGIWKFHKTLSAIFAVNYFHGGSNLNSIMMQNMSDTAHFQLQHNSAQWHVNPISSPEDVRDTRLHLAQRSRLTHLKFALPAILHKVGLPKPSKIECSVNFSNPLSSELSYSRTRISEYLANRVILGAEVRKCVFENTVSSMLSDAGVARIVNSFTTSQTSVKCPEFESCFGMCGWDSYQRPRWVGI